LAGAFLAGAFLAAAFFFAGAFFAVFLVAISILPDFFCGATVPVEFAVQVAACGAVVNTSFDKFT
jgi:hypothetical protein